LNEDTFYQNKCGKRGIEGISPSYLEEEYVCIILTPIAIKSSQVSFFNLIVQKLIL
tara:strand:+ start:439 stop:606 length:168 start_codon:yes stop_codon:yes gene_type:complete